MKKLSLILTSAIILLANSAFAQEGVDRGFFFYNGLHASITAAYWTPAENCEVYNCGSWSADQIEPADLLPLGTRTGVGFLLGQKEQQDAPCKWDLKADLIHPDGKTETVVFKGLQFCDPPITSVDFVRDRSGVVVLQRFTDERGAVQFRHYPAVK